MCTSFCLPPGCAGITAPTAPARKPRPKVEKVDKASNETVSKTEEDNSIQTLHEAGTPGRGYGYCVDTRISCGCQPTVTVAVCSSRVQKSDMKGKGSFQDPLRIRTRLANYDPMAALTKAPAAPENGVDDGDDGISSEAKALQEVPQILLRAAKLRFYETCASADGYIQHWTCLPAAYDRNRKSSLSALSKYLLESRLQVSAIKASPFWHRIYR